MSLLNEEKKFYYKNNNKNLNIKQNNIKNKNIKNNHKKIYNGVSQDPFSSSNSSSQNNKIISPTWNNATNYSNNKFPNNSKKKENIIKDEYNLFNKKIKKKKEENNYKHNKSLEDISLNKDILLQYKIESPLIPGNTDNCGNEIIEILNLNGSNDNNKNNKAKKLNKKKLNNSYILQSKYKSIINDNKNENRNLYKMNEYITENNNISYKNKNKKEKVNKNIDILNYDIDNKEFIIESNDKNEIFKNNKKNEDNLILDNLITKNEKINKNINNNINKNVNNNLNNNLKDLNIDEYLLNSSFENNKSDFGLLYTNNYHKNIKNDMLFMEIQLLIEKILELQKSYHQEYKNLYFGYEKEKEMVKLNNEKYILLKKKIINFLKYKEKRNLKENNNVYIGFNIKKNIINGSNKINKNEIILWNKMFPIKEKIDENNNKKNKLKQIFKTIVFDRYKLINNKLNDIEKNIVNRLIKKYQYNNKSNIISNSTNKKGLNNYKKPINNNKGNGKITKKLNGYNFNKNYSGNSNFKFNIRNKFY